MNSVISRLSTALATRYRVDRELGAGGMATVYLAHDLKHEREVAIKVLHPDLGAALGGERFLTEIKTTAKLQHPHILPLLDSGEAGGLLYYVMPYVRGETLRARLERERQLPIADAVRIAREVSSALEHAHKQGIIHRDIKPENILLQDGAVLVADFGIALAVQTAGGARMTQTGLSLGTPSYMSPEQAMGERTIDARSDIYALGAVTYEMLTGEPPFSGMSVQAIVAKVLSERPVPPSTMRDTVPPHVERTVLQALAKVPADRSVTAAAFASSLEDAGSGTSPVNSSARTKPNRSRSHAVSLLALLVGVVVTAVLAFRRNATDELPVQFGSTTHVTWDPALEVTPALSPDGKYVAYGGGQVLRLRILVRPVGEGRTQALTGDTSALESDPQWSPDGTRILFLSRGGVFSAPAGGGAARPEIPPGGRLPITSATWAPDGRRIAFTRADTVYLREDVGTIRALTALPDPSLCRWSPDSVWIACAIANPLYSAATHDFGNRTSGGVVLVRVHDGRVVPVTDVNEQNTSPTWSSNGRWLFFLSDRDGRRDMYGIQIGSDGPAGDTPLRLTTGLGAHTISLSADGRRLAYSSYSNRNAVWRMPLPTAPNAGTANAHQLTNANEIIEHFNVSPDGRALVYDSDLPGHVDIFRVAIAGGEAERLTSMPSNEFSPSYSPDGREIVFHAMQKGNRDLFVVPAEGGTPRRITSTEIQENRAEWSPDGRALVFLDNRARRGIGLLRRDASGVWGEPRLRLARGTRPAWSPDGARLAFISDPAGGDVEVVSVDSGEPQVVHDGAKAGPATSVVWGRDDLLYVMRRGDEKTWRITAMQPDGSDPRDLVRFDLPVMARVFRVWLGQLYFVSESRESDVWVLDVSPRQ